MTLGKLIRELQSIEKKYGGRKKVTIRLGELRLVSDEFSHWELSECTDDIIPWTCQRTGTR